MVTTVVRQDKVPEDLRSHSTLAEPDYVDVFTLTTGATDVRWPEYWTRAAIESAAGFKGQLVWRVLLGLRLDARPENVGGWKIADNGDRWMTLEAASWFLTAQIVVAIDDGRVTVGTFVKYDRRIAAVVWPPLSIIHRRAMPGLLRHTARIVSGGKQE